jgi:hypothetical protein
MSHFIRPKNFIVAAFLASCSADDAVTTYTCSDGLINPTDVLSTVELIVSKTVPTLTVVIPDNPTGAYYCTVSVDPKDSTTLYSESCNVHSIKEGYSPTGVQAAFHQDSNILEILWDSESRQYYYSCDSTPSTVSE